MVDTSASIKEVVSDKTLVDLLISKVVQEVEEYTEQRQARRFGVLATLLSGFLALVAGIVGYFFETIIDTKIMTVVDQKMQASLDYKIPMLSEELKKNISDDAQHEIIRIAKEESDYSQLTFLALSMEINPGFSQDERDAVMNLLIDLKKSGGYAGRKNFPVLLHKVVSALHGADQGYEIRQIDVMYRDDMLRSGPIVETLLQHFGWALLGSIDAPNDWSQSDLDAFHAYSQASSRYGLKALGYSFEVLKKFVEGGRTKSNMVDSLIHEIVNQQETLDVFNNLEFLSDPSQMSSAAIVPESVTRISTITNSLLELYPELRPF